jgi:hypothetical protein
MPSSRASRQIWKGLHAALLDKEEPRETVWKVPTGTKPGLTGRNGEVRRPYFRVAG